jgi:hypothetical protein
MKAVAAIALLTLSFYAFSVGWGLYAQWRCSRPPGTFNAFVWTADNCPWVASLHDRLGPSVVFCHLTELCGITK